MRGSVVLAGAILGAVSLVGVPAQAGAAPDPYSGGIETECTIKVPKVVEAGKRVVIKVAVHANTPPPPTGEVRVAISSGGDLVWDKTVTYNGGTKKIVGPVLAVRRYTATAQFTSADGTFARCRASGTFRVGVLGDNENNDNDGSSDDNGIGGLLPDTGGPAMLWLLLGVGLVGGGAATVVYARRRNSPATA